MPTKETSKRQLVLNIFHTVEGGGGELKNFVFKMRSTLLIALMTYQVHCAKQTSICEGQSTLSQLMLTRCDEIHSRISLRGGTSQVSKPNNVGKGTKLSEKQQGATLNDKLSLLKHIDFRKFSKYQTNEIRICALPTMVGQQVLVLMTDGRNMCGTLESFDRNTNLMLRDVSERVFPKFDIVESCEELETPVTWPSSLSEDKPIDWARAAGVASLT